MDNIISAYCVHDIQEVDEYTKKLSDKELIKVYIFEIDLKPWHEICEGKIKITGDVFKEIYNRGLNEVRSFLLKRVIKERSNMSYPQAFEKYYEYYWKKYKVKTNPS